MTYSVRSVSGMNHQEGSLPPTTLLYNAICQALWWDGSVVCRGSNSEGIWKWGSIYKIPHDWLQICSMEESSSSDEECLSEPEYVVAPSSSTTTLALYRAASATCYHSYCYHSYCYGTKYMCTYFYIYNYSYIFINIIHAHTFAYSFSSKWSCFCWGQVLFSAPGLADVPALVSGLWRFAAVHPLGGDEQGLYGAHGPDAEFVWYMCANVCPENHRNGGTYTIHGSYGVRCLRCQQNWRVDGCCLWSIKVVQGCSGGLFASAMATQVLRFRIGKARFPPPFCY